MKISNRTKDIMLLLGILFVIFFILIGFCVAVVECFAETNKQIEEYHSRPLIIRAETDEDRAYNEMWRKQYQEQYGVEFDEQGENNV